MEKELQIPEMDKSETATTNEEINKSTQIEKSSDASGEQPNEKVTDVLAASAEEKSLDTVSTLSKGSPYGKFVSAEALVNAYNNLQSEFTKKCQKLSEMEKNACDNVLENSQVEMAVPEQPETKAPLFETEGWNERVADFLSTNSSAKNYSREICEEILNNPQKYSGVQALENAWAFVASKNFVSKENLGKDEKFLSEYVYSNSDVKEKVLKLFLDELDEKKPPNLISSSGQSSFSAPQTAKTLEQAKAIVTNMFL